jgi:hypothetical protein
MTRDVHSQLDKHPWLAAGGTPTYSSGPYAHEARSMTGWLIIFHPQKSFAKVRSNEKIGSQRLCRNARGR